jgi:hypothetical protein
LTNLCEIFLLDFRDKVKCRYYKSYLNFEALKTSAIADVSTNRNVGSENFTAAAGVPINQGVNTF